MICMVLNFLILLNLYKGSVELFGLLGTIYQCVAEITLQLEDAKALCVMHRLACYAACGYF